MLPWNHIMRERDASHVLRVDLIATENRREAQEIELIMFTRWSAKIVKEKCRCCYGGRKKSWK